ITLIIIILLALGAGGYAISKKDAAPEPVVETPTEDERVRAPEDKVISVGEPTEISGLTVTLNKVTDSRCPTGVQCIWAGEATASVTLAQGAETSTIDMKLDAGSVEFAGYNVSLTAALPYPTEGVSVAQDDYMLVFHVAPVIGGGENI
ncbi:MAG: hypothetical protein QG633_514, partial [Patescibacteria group bacterium]|nr:hypothetical protein [Patescibacteria group bacterium]